MCTEGEPKARVLLADDESVNRAVLRRAIERGGFDAVETSTGAEAVRAFQKLGKENGGFLCVLMDINMPDMDGLEAAWRIRQMEGTCERCRSRRPAGPGQEISDGGCRECCRVPIWAVSACSDRDQAFSPVVQRLPASCSKDGPIWRQVGMDEFMTKPVNVHQLQHKLAKLQMEMRRCKSGDNLATGDANLRMELASSGSLTRSWSDSQVWECPTMEACRAEDSSPLPRPPQPSKDSPPALAGSLHLPSIPALRVQRQGCQIP